MLLLRSHWKNYYVRVGDETIYHRNGKRDGSVHLFDIPSGDSLTISFIGGTKDNLKDIESSGILIGDKTSMYRRIIKDNLYAVLIGVLSLVLFHIAVPSSGIYQRDHAGQTQDAVRDG